MTIKTAIKLAAIAVTVTALSACSGRDTELSEKLAAVEAAAKRAELAAVRAERAAQTAEARPVAEVAEVADHEADPENDTAQDDASSQDHNSQAFQNGG